MYLSHTEMWSGYACTALKTSRDSLSKIIDCFSAGKIALTVRYFPHLLAIIYIAEEFNFLTIGYSASCKN